MEIIQDYNIRFPTNQGTSAIDLLSEIFVKSWLFHKTTTRVKNRHTLTGFVFLIKNDHTLRVFLMYMESENKKLPFLYHGSPHKFEKLKVQPHRNEKAVYATSNIVIASMYMLKHVGLTGSFIVNGGQVYYALLFMDREEFLKIDKGGHIYVLPNDTFEPSPYKGMQNEWVSKESIKPIKILEYNPALDAVLTEYGVQVYFLNRTMYNDINKAKGHGYSILKNLESENKRREINFKEI